MKVVLTGSGRVMVGRAGELERLLATLARVADSEVVFVSGEAGVGKSRLLREFLAGLPAGTPVLTGQAEEGGTGRPYGLLLEAVQPFVAHWATVPEPLTARRETLTVLLSPVAPELQAGPERNYAPHELRQAAAELVRHLGGAGPMVLVFEDLQWADPESLALFGWLAAIARLPMLMVGTYRPEGLSRRELAGLKASLKRRRSFEHISVPPLGQSEVAELLAAIYGGPVPLRAVEAVHRRSGGNPYFIEELLLAAGAAPPEDLAFLPLPASATEAVLRHLDGLGLDARGVVDAAAVLGQRIIFDLLATVTGLTEEALIGSLRALVDRGLLVEEDTDVFSFRHALTREAVADRLLGRERRRLHERALLALQATGSKDWAALARHAAGAGHWDELSSAARRGSAAYLRDGATLQALHLAELGLSEGAADLDLFELAARAAWSVGLRQSAVEHAERWRQLARAAGEDVLHLQALHLLARLRWETGDREGQRESAEEALAVAERVGPSEELVSAYNLVSESRLLAREHEEALLWAGRALDLAENIGVTGLRPAILVNQASALSSLFGRVEEAAALLEQAVAEAEGQGDHQTALRALHNLVVAMYMVWPPARTRAVLKDMTELAERSGRHDWKGEIGSLEASLLADVEGDLPAARNLLRALAQDESFLDVEGGRWVALRDAEFAMEGGELERAGELLERARQQAGRRGDLEQLTWSAALEAEMTARRGDPLEAARRLTAVLDTIGQMEAGTGAGWSSDAWFSGLHAALQAGLDASAARKLGGQPSLARAIGHPYNDAAWPAHLEGATLEREGRHEAALDPYRQALTDRGRPRRVPLTADVHQGLARTLLALGQVEAARSHAEQAASLLVRWSGWRKAEADGLLRRLGGGRPVSGPEGLTSREREVAALLAEGLSNAELGQRLYISAKTASVHVSNILAKLGMSSRTEIAAWALRTGLAS